MTSRALWLVVLGTLGFIGCASSPDRGDPADTSETEQALACDLDTPGALALACEKASKPMSTTAGVLGSDTAPPTNPNIVAWGVKLVDGAGQVEMDIEEPGDYDIYLGTPNIAFQLRDAIQRVDVEPTCTGSIASTDCQYLRKVRTYHLTKSNYLLEIGPSALSYVRVFIQQHVPTAPVCTAGELTQEEDTCALADAGSTVVAAAPVTAFSAPQLAQDTIYTVALDDTGAGSIAFVTQDAGTYELYLGTPNLPLRVFSGSSSGRLFSMPCTEYIPSTECSKLRRGDVLILDATDIVRIDIGPHAGTKYLRIALRKSETSASGPLKLGPPASYSVGADIGALYLTTGFYNQDTFRDIAASVADDAGGISYVAAMKNLGDGSFELATQTPTSLPMQLVSADFDGDDFADVAGIAWDGQGPLPAFYLRGDGNFGFAKSTWDPGRDFNHTLAAADFDEDGAPDLLATWTDSQGTSGDGGFVIYRMPTFAILDDLPAYGTSTLQAAAGDVDGDGHQDVVVASRTESLVKVFRGDGTGTVTYQYDLSLPGNALVALSLIDLDGDGRSDIVAAHQDNTITVSYASATGYGVPAVVVVQDHSFFETIHAADLDHDGRLDLIVGDAGPNGEIGVFTATGTGGFAQASLLNVGNDSAIGDFNNDGIVDLATSGFSGVTVYLGTP